MPRLFRDRLLCFLAEFSVDLFLPFWEQHKSHLLAAPLTVFVRNSPAVIFVEVRIIGRKMKKLTSLSFIDLGDGVVNFRGWKHGNPWGGITGFRGALLPLSQPWNIVLLSDARAAQWPVYFL